MKASANAATTVEELRRSLQKVLRWAEAYEPSRQHRYAYDADLDEAAALLVESRIGSSFDLVQAPTVWRSTRAPTAMFVSCRSACWIQGSQAQMPCTAPTLSCRFLKWWRTTRA